LILLYILLPLLQLILQNKKVTITLLVLLIAINFAVRICSLIYEVQVDSYVIQTFRLYTWILYFLVGGIIYKIKDSLIIKVPLKVNLFFMGFTYIVLIVYSCLISKYYFVDNHYCEYYYASPLCLAAVVFIFLFCIRLKINNEHVIKFISIISLCGKGIWVVHIGVFAVYAKGFNALDSFGWYIQLLAPFVVFGVSFLIVFVMKHVPFVKKYFC